MRTMALIAADTFTACRRGAVLWVVLGLAAVGVTAVMVTVANVPRSLMAAAAGLVESGEIPELSIDPDAARRGEKADAAVGLDDETYALVMQDTARDATFRYVIGTGGMLLAILMGVFVNETRSARIQTVIARPIRRSHVALGQLAGGLGVVILGLAMMSLCHYAMTAAVGRVSCPRCFLAAAAILPNLLVAAAMAYALATATHVLVATGVAVLLSTSFTTLGSVTEYLSRAGVDGVIARAVGAAHAVLPRFLEVRRAGEDLLFGESLPGGYGVAIAVDVVYLVLFVAISCRVFGRREV